MMAELDIADGVQVALKVLVDVQGIIEGQTEAASSLDPA